jgi:uroporphyrin-III C-methyltransferase/precorrin-2 dehydrogenase/sirohydrochlorin ferrochelatase
MHALSELLSEGEPLAPKSPGALAALARRLLRAATDLATRLRGNVWLATQTRDRAVALGPLQRPARGCVMLVGAGPGDPELLTLKALQAVRGADVILYDQLVSDEILALAPARAERIAVGKKGYGKACKQGEINELMVAFGAAGRRVVRLKAGDPLMFGRLEEEMAALDAAGIRFDVVPGISAAQGAAVRLKISLTRRRGARRFQAITGHAADGHLPGDFDWAGLADPKATTAVYMPKATIDDLCAELLQQGLSPDHPAAAVFNVTRADEVVLAATIATLPKRIAEASSDAPCIVLIGDAVARRAPASRAQQELVRAGLKPGAMVCL